MADDFLLCGCPSTPGHRDGCVLAEAETIAIEAAGQARANGDHEMLTALTALADADLLLDVDTEETLLGVLDALYDAGLLVGYLLPRAIPDAADAASGAGS